MLHYTYSLPNDTSDIEVNGKKYYHSIDCCGNCNGEFKCKGCQYPLHKQLYKGG